MQRFSFLIDFNVQSSSLLKKSSENLAVSRDRPGPREFRIGCQLERKIDIAVFVSVRCGYAGRTRGADRNTPLTSTWQRPRCGLMPFSRSCRAVTIHKGTVTDKVKAVV